LLLVQPPTLASATITGAATVGTTLGVTGASTFTGAVVCNGAVTLGDAVGDAITATGSFTSYNGQNPSAIRAAASDYAAVAFDGGTASTRITSTLTGQNIGTGDFSVWARFRVPATAGNGPGIIQFSSSATPNNSANGFTLQIRSSGGGTIAARINGASASDFRLVDGGNIVTTYAGQVIDVVFTRTGSTVAMYINGTSVALTTTTGGTVPAWSDTITSTYCHIGAFDSSTIFTGRIYRSVVFNRALSAGDVTELITVGVNPADQWGTQTAVYTSDFSAGVDGWAAVRGTADGNIDGISGVDNTLRLTVDSTASNTHFVNRTPFSGLLVGKRYRVGFDYFITAANVTMNGLRLQQITTAQILSPIQSVTGAWTSITPVEFVSTESRLDVLGYAGAAPTFTGNGTDTFTRIGAIVDLDFTVGTGYQATDRSTNALHGTLFNGVAFTEPKRVAVLYATTSTSGNQQMLGTLAIPTNAIIEDIIVNSTGSATVSVGNASAGTQIVNGASVVSGRQKLTLATPFSTTGNLWVNSSTTATLQFTILYTVAA
jgi:fibronectin-binding autotransporter adhesin